jgi:hypothetical protein
MYIVRVGDDYVQFVDEATSRVILTSNRDEAGAYSEAGAHIVMGMVELLYPEENTEVTH